MSPRPRHSATARHHIEWLQLVDISGPFLSLSILVETFPQGLDADDPEIAGRLGQAFSEWQANEALRRPDPAIHREFARLVLREVLEYEAVLAEGAEVADLKATLPEHRVTLRPDLAVRKSGGKPSLLVTTYKGGTSLERPLDERGFHASPAERMRLLLRGANISSGLVTNGEEWMLVHALADRTSTFVTWQTQLLLEERVTLRAFRSLLAVRRLFGVPEPETLDGLFERSRDDEREVTDQLGRQVRRAVELLVAAFDGADRASNGRVTEAVRKLERNEEVPETLYETAVVIAMRMIFLLAAEARGLLPDEGAWVESYAVTPLRAELQEVADRSGPELLDRRFDAWPRLLATFRAVHGGVEHSRIRLPGYGGGLFDPGRYPFLESVDGHPLRISNRAILHVLDAIQTLEVDVPGGRERRPLSFRALGVEQIGHVYEGLLDHTAIRADAPAVGLLGTTKKEPEFALSELERTRGEGEDALLELLKEETGRGVPALRKALAAEPDLARVGRLRAACEGADELVSRITPFLGLVRDDPYGLPMVFHEGAVYVTTSPGRRATGTHYTPPSLTEPIVRYALEPVVYSGPAEGLEAEQWTLKAPHDLLDLKVCDIAMGSAAFLVAACRYLAARLVEAWEECPDEMPQDAGADLEERDLTARRLVAERCLYGVDKNPLAVEIAKVSMWLTTMRRDRPFTFLDHALRHGDSLLGVTSVDQLERLTLKPEEADSVLLEPAREAIRATLDEVRAVRERIGATDAVDIRGVDEKAASLALADERTAALRTVGDLIVGAALEEAGGKAKAATTVEAAVGDICVALLADSDVERADLIARVEARAGDALMVGRAPDDSDPPKPFHWVLEFPEVFERERSGFQAIVGNPPFLGGKRISTQLGRAFEALLTAFVGERGAADLSAHFLRRGASLAAHFGSLGLITTDRISQGDTRSIGTMYVVNQGWQIVRAEPSREWPGEAATHFAELHFYRSHWNGSSVLSGKTVERINSSLRAETREVEPEVLHQPVLASIGTYVYGEGFVLTRAEAEELVAGDEKEVAAIKPYLIASDLTATPDQGPRRLIIDLSAAETYDDATKFPRLMKHLEETVKPVRDALTDQIHQDCFWRFWDLRPDLYEALAPLDRVIVCPRVSRSISFARVPSTYIFGDRLVVIAHEGADLLAVLQSVVHELWIDRFKTTMGASPTYVIKKCFRTFPLPGSSQWQNLEPSGERYERVRADAMTARGVGLTALHALLHDAEVMDSCITALREAQVQMDLAVVEAYGWTDLELDYDFRATPVGRRYTISDQLKIEVLDRLLELNHERHADEVRRGLHAKGKPKRKRQPTAAADTGAARLFGDG